MQNNRRHGNNSSDGQAARVAHEDLGRVGVEPQESDKRTDEGCQEDYNFFTAWDIHQVEVACSDRVAGDVGQNDQCNADDGRVARCHAVHAIIEVGSV